MGENNTQLPAEVVDLIATQGETFANKYLNGKVNTHEFGLLEEAWNAGATEYATKLHEVEQKNLSHECMIKTLQERVTSLQQENDELMRWKIEAVELLTKIHSYAHKHLEIKLGQCTVDFIIARSKERDELKERCDKMAAALEWIKTYGPDQSQEGQAFIDKALAGYRSPEGKKEVEGDSK